VLEHGDHVFVGLLVEMMDFVALVQDVSHQVWRWRICDRRRDNIGHIAGILVFRKTKLWVGEELSNRGQVNVTTAKH
jgi:hypothetical protein